MLQHLPVLTIMVPMFAGLLVPLLARVHAGIVRPLTIGALGFSCFAAIHMLLHVQGGHPIEYAMGGWPIPTGIGYRVDGLNAMVLVMIAVIGLLTALWMRRSIEDELPAAARPGYHAVLLLACTGFLGITITAGAPSVFAASATAWPWLPDEYVITPRRRLSAGNCAIMLNAPRILKAPIGWRFSHFRKREVLKSCLPAEALA